MKELLTGIAVGLIVGAIVTESNASARNLVKKGRKAFQKQFDNITDKL